MEHVTPGIAVSRAFDMAAARIALTYLFRHGCLPNLRNPAKFTELVQARKLNDRDARLPLFADKVRMKQIVADRLGPAWVIPTLWHGIKLPDRAPWPRPFVVKSRHGCNQNRFILSQNDDWTAVCRAADGWVGKTYGRWLDEWLYELIPPGILVEPFIGRGGELPIDYKFYVFGGRVEYVQVHLGRGVHHRWIVMDRMWSRASAKTADPDPQCPVSLAAMIAAAEDLGRGLEFVRVDLYEVDDRPLFGEMTFYPGSGLDRFDPPALDRIIGAKWLAARHHACTADASADFVSNGLEAASV